MNDNIEKLYNVINESNWCKGSLSSLNYNGGIRRCLLGWIDVRSNHCNEASQILAKVREKGFNSISCFNDAKETKVEDVIALCRELDL